MSPRAACLGPCSAEFWTSPWMETSQPFWSSSLWKIVSWCSEGTSYVAVCAIAFGPAPGHHRKQPGTIFFIPSIQVFIDIDKIPSEHSFSSSREFSQLFQPSSVEGCSRLLTICKALHWPASSMSMSLP